MIEKEIPVLYSLCDQSECLSLSSLLGISQELASLDSEKMGFGPHEVFDKGHLWVISRTSLIVYTLPKYQEKVIFRTYPLKNKMFFYPRVFTIESENNEKLVEGLSIWALIDKDTRKFLLPKESGVIYDKDDGETLVIDTKIKPETTTFCLERTVLYSDLDINGHMNNINYVNWALDALGSSFFSRHKLKEFRIAYHKEAREGDVLTLNIYQDDYNIYILGTRHEEKIFELSLLLV